MIKIQTYFIRSLVLIVCIVNGLVATAAFAGDVDPRFDGRWVGTETFQVTVSSVAGGGNDAMGMGASISSSTRQTPQTVAAILGISDHGKTVGITKGFARGRYEPVPGKSGGKTLAFQMPGTNGDKLLFVGRQHCKLTLSADGNTIKETGIAILSVSKDGQGTSAPVFGTFKRQGRY